MRTFPRNEPVRTASELDTTPNSAVDGEKIQDGADEIAVLAHRVGLQHAMALFPEDVARAAASAAEARAMLRELGEVAAEPWPPMRIRNCR